MIGNTQHLYDEQGCDCPRLAALCSKNDDDAVPVLVVSLLIEPQWRGETREFFEYFFRINKRF
jgi:hypothetical protein